MRGPSRKPLLVTIFVNIGTIHTPTDAKRIQNFLICIEMALAAVFMRVAFPAREYWFVVSGAGASADESS